MSRECTLIHTDNMHQRGGGWAMGCLNVSRLIIQITIATYRPELLLDVNACRM